MFLFPFYFFILIFSSIWHFQFCCSLKSGALSAAVHYITWVSLDTLLANLRLKLSVEWPETQEPIMAAYLEWDGVIQSQQCHLPLLQLNTALAFPFKLYFYSCTQTYLYTW